MTYPTSEAASASAKRGRRAAASALLVSLTLVVGLLVLGASYYALWRPAGDPAATPGPTSIAETSPTVTRPTPAGESGEALRADALRTLNTLRQTQVQPRDLYSIVARLKAGSRTPIPRTTGKPPGNYEVGHRDAFFVHDIAARNYYSITARVHLVTDNVYWYVQEGEGVDESALREAAEQFERRIYPTNTRVFGSEWKPGVDNDPRITVLLADIPNVGGYYSSADEYTRAINPYSNEREMLYISVGGGWDGISGTLAHEYQHMIHWHASPNHDVWLNEGAAVMAEALNGYSEVGVDRGFMGDTDLQLNAWQQTPGESLRHYGAAFLFLEYLRSQYGGERILRALVSADGQGADAVGNALRSLGNAEEFESAFKEWVAANLLDGIEGAPPKLSYPDREVSIELSEQVSSLPANIEGSVAQFGSDYIEILPLEGGGDLTLEFSGPSRVGVVEAGARSGRRFWWSNRGDVSNTHMTRRFDLRGIEQATLDFNIWHDLEKDFDYGYVEVSTDDGATWETLRGEYTTTDNPNGANLGNAYTGKSKEQGNAAQGGWLRESIDLTPYAGKEVQVRFEYITDDGYNAQGFAIDDISIPELGYSDDAEGESDWQTSGFAHISDKLPQEYYLAVVLFGSREPRVRPIAVDTEGKATFKLESMGSEYTSAVLIVSGVTPYTLERAQYRLDVRSDE